VIVADTSAIVALLDRDDRHHQVLRSAFEAHLHEWIVPWAILPEVDYIVHTRLGVDVARAFRQDVAEGTFTIGWSEAADIRRAVELDQTYSALSLGLVDGVVMAMAEKLEARAIATLDVRDFGAVELKGRPDLWPRDQ
jgi:predicted nucleic acid-binding protein